VVALLGAAALMAIALPAWRASHTRRSNHSAARGADRSRRHAT
jgi:hypothetical protein